MARVKSIKHQLQRNIEASHNAGRGNSKRGDRMSGEGTATKVYSDQTARNYCAVCAQFGNWVRENHPEAWKDMNAAQALVPEFLETQQNVGTRKAYACALAKGFGLPSAAKAWGSQGTRHATEITKGRKLTARAQAWRQNHPIESEACRCSGLRCLKEAKPLQGRDVIVQPDGSVKLHILRGKGGRERWSPVWQAPGNTTGRDWFIQRAQEVGPHGYIFDGVPDLKNANLHAFRAEYSVRIYDSADALENGRSYKPADGSALELDKGRIAAVSEALGHGDDREHTNYYNYLSYGRDNN